ncbi:MAG: glycosyltransferase family 1 protein [Anaerolineae bacterium]|nr:glycosyltransferase family 4 protein [Candidatus Roseilinea sp.]MDW8450999.1 glycosyltransferase family 1 protein [Anaerolineae bacterium]
MYYRKAGVSYYTRRLVRALAGLQAPRFALRILLDRRDADTGWVPPNVGVVRAATPAHHRYEHVALPVELAARGLLRAPHAVLHSPDFVTCWGRFRKVITIHDLYFMEHPEVMSADGMRYYSRIRWSASVADRIIAVSHFTRQDILRLIPEAAPEKVVVVHEAADEKLKIENGELKREWPTPHSQFSIFNFQFILFVGTLEPRKNLSTLLRALARLPAEVRLVVVGAVGWRNEALGDVARELGVADRVTFAGWVSDDELDALYCRARLLVMPSLSEGFGLPVLEAMSRGTPVVCSSAGSLPEIAADAALLHEPMDDAELAQHIHALWMDDALHAEYARRGLARAQRFSWARAARETLAVYREALG